MPYTDDAMLAVLEKASKAVASQRRKMGEPAKITCSSLDEIECFMMAVEFGYIRDNKSDGESVGFLVDNVEPAGHRELYLLLEKKAAKEREAKNDKRATKDSLVFHRTYIAAVVAAILAFGGIVVGVISILCSK